MKKLTLSEMMCVSGAGNYADKHDPGNSKNSRSNAGKSNFNAPGVASCNNGVLGGMISGSLGGVPGIALGLFGGAIAGGCFNRGNNNKTGPSSSCNGSNNSSAGNYGGQCTR